MCIARHTAALSGLVLQKQIRSNPKSLPPSRDYIDCISKSVIRVTAGSLGHAQNCAHFAPPANARWSSRRLALWPCLAMCFYSCAKLAFSAHALNAKRPHREQQDRTLEMRHMQAERARADKQPCKRESCVNERGASALPYAALSLLYG